MEGCLQVNTHDNDNQGEDGDHRESLARTGSSTFSVLILPILKIVTATNMMIGWNKSSQVPLMTRSMMPNKAWTSSSMEVTLTRAG